jgi:hypothetical protein
MSDQNNYWVITSRAKGGANNPFGGSATANQISQLVQMTEDQIRKEYQDSGQLQDKFGSFDSYMGYINDSQDFVQSAEWMMINPEYKTGSKEWAFLNGEDLAWKPGEREQIQQTIIQDRLNARTSAFEQWMGSEAGSALMEKYGIEPLIQNNDGDKFRWTGSGYQKFYKVDDHASVGDYIKTALVTGLSLAATPAVAGALGGIGGAALPAGVAGPAAPLLSSGVANGLAAGATSAASQGLLTGKIDPGSVLSSAVIGGFNPGGYVADNYAPWAPNGQFQLGGAPPSSFYGGLISGTVNDVVKNGLVNGEFDLQDSLEKGLVSGGINSLTNAYQEWNKNSLENLADQVEYTMPGIDRATAESFAAMNPDLNKLDFGALIGEGGLLPFIPKLDVTGIRGITDTVGSAFDGLLNGVELNDQFQLADGSYIDVDKVTPEQEIAALQKYGGFNTLEDRQTIGLLNNPLVNGITNTLGNLIPEGGLSEDLQTQVQLYGSEWDSQNSPNQFNTLDPNAEEYDTSAYYTPEGGLTTAGQVAKNNFIETKITNLGSFDYDLSGGLNENYSWSSNPRGNSELWGTLQNIPGLFSQGSNNLGGAITPPKNPDGSTVKPLNLNGELINPEALVTVDAGGAVLPSNNDSAIRNQNIIDYFDLLNGGLATDSTASATDSTASATEVEVDTTKDLDKDTASTVSTVSNTSDTSSIDDTLSTTTTKAIDTGNVISSDVVTTAVVPETYVDPEVIVPGSTTLSGGGSPPLNLSGNSDKGLPVLWGMLDPYTKFRGYAKKRQDLYSKMMKALEAKDSGGMLSTRSTFLTPRERELFEAGEFKR